MIAESFNKWGGFSTLTQGIYRLTKIIFGLRLNFSENILFLKRILWNWGGFSNIKKISVCGLIFPKILYFQKVNIYFYVLSFPKIYYFPKNVSFFQKYLVKKIKDWRPPRCVVAVGEILHNDHDASHNLHSVAEKIWESRDFLTDNNTSTITAESTIKGIYQEVLFCVNVGWYNNTVEVVYDILFDTTAINSRAYCACAKVLCAVARAVGLLLEQHHRDFCLFAASSSCLDSINSHCSFRSSSRRTNERTNEAWVVCLFETRKLLYG